MLISVKKMIVVLLVTVPSMAQTNFRMEKGSVIWEHTLPIGTNMKAIIDSQAKLTISAFDDTSYRGKADAVKNTTDANSVRLKCDASFDFIVTMTPEGYKVKVTNFMFVEKYGPMQLRIVPGSLEKYYVEYGKIRNSPKTQTDLSYVDSFLTGVFTIQAPAQEVAQGSQQNIAQTAK